MAPVSTTGVTLTRLLIANNGIAAVKAIRSMRRWCYQVHANENAIQMVVMATPQDIEANLEYIHLADQYIEIAGGPSSVNYGNVNVIVQAAIQTQCQAVWPGWGHCSENPLLPEKLAELGIIFIGPTPAAMRLLGDKISSTILAQSIGIPVIPWSGSGVNVDPENLIVGGCHIDNDTYRRCMVTNEKEALDMAKKVGFPLMIKASEGGGGKGIRRVQNEGEFTSLFRQVRHEVVGSPVFLMKEAQGARHLEVQLLCDQYGNCITLFGRDCSIQRRHQKIIEEAPITIAENRITRQMEEAAIRLAKLVGYVNAGTVEFLFDPEKKEFYFLELNPRLQVEHPTTEMITDVNIPAAQLQIAMGAVLSDIESVKSFCLADSRPPPHGHVIACRITSENPEDEFRPCGGVLKELNFRSFSHTWGYFSVNSNSSVHEYSDSQFGHIFAWGLTREQSRMNMIMALKELKIHGEFRTSVEYLVSLLEHGTFTQNSFNTLWLDSLLSQKAYQSSLIPEVAIICAGAFNGYHYFTNRRKNLLNLLSKGHLPSHDFLHPEFSFRPIYQNTLYEMIICQTGPDSLTIYVNLSTEINVIVRELPNSQLLIQLGMRSHICHVMDTAEGIQVNVDEKSIMLEHDTDPRSLYSSSFGKLTRCVIQDGEKVQAGQTFAEVEVMKMIMPLISRNSGILAWKKQEGACLEPGMLIASLQLDDAWSVSLPKQFSGSLPDFGSTLFQNSNVFLNAEKCIKRINNILEGYQIRKNEVNAIVNELVSSLLDPLFPYAELENLIYTHTSQFLRTQVDSIKVFMEFHRDKGHFPISEFEALVSEMEVELRTDSNIQSTFILPLLNEFLEKHREGLHVYKTKTLLQFVDSFLNVEELFCGIEGGSDTKSILQLRGSNNSNIEKVLYLIQSHANIELKSRLMEDVIPMLWNEKDEQTIEELCIPTLKRLIRLTSPETRSISIVAKNLLVQRLLPSLEERREKMEIIFQKATSSVGEGKFQIDSQLLKSIVVSDNVAFDVLTSFFFNTATPIVLASFETYIRRAFHMYSLLKVSHIIDENSPFCFWEFKQHERRLRRMGEFEGRNADKISLGMMCTLNSLKNGATILIKLASSLGYKLIEEESISDLRNMLYVLVEKRVHPDELLFFLELSKLELLQLHIRQITFLTIKPFSYPEYYNFYLSADGNYQEDVSIRHIEPAMAYQLELKRLSNYDIVPLPSQNSEIHLYYATGKQNPLDRRLFARAISRTNLLKSNICAKEHLLSECESLLENILNEIELASHGLHTDCNHVFCYFMSTFSFNPMTLTTNEWSALFQRYGSRMWKLRISHGEIRIPVHIPNGTTNPAKTTMFRIYINNLSGYVNQMEMYLEEESDEGLFCHHCVHGIGKYHLKATTEPYVNNDRLQHQRYRAHELGTTYVYDFPDLFRQGLCEVWNDYKHAPCKSDLLQVEEMILRDDKKGIIAKKDMGTKGKVKIGMVGWLMTMVTPEYPEGRETMVVANDITFKAGSFSVDEDHMYYQCILYAREKGIPFIYLSANSGARIGLGDEFISKYQVCWRDPSSPEHGFEYIYLSQDQYESLSEREKSAIISQKLTANNETRYKIDSLIGVVDGIGIENLKGSGLIAGATAAAYRDIFTISLVTCRTVGIGAYLVRLGQRVIQVNRHPILLTGYEALNKLLGKKVYKSNLELGGTEIMYENGVSHMTVKNDFQGILKILTWLSFVPKKRGDPVSIRVPNRDVIDRPVWYSYNKCDMSARNMIQGRETTVDDETLWEGGLFDRDSFVETLGGWAKTVITGRARLGGIPVGVIAVETQVVERLIPADPADPESSEQSIPEARQVWHPNSAFKTAQAIQDFNHGEQLPLIILANWRGFSGGKKDMYHEVVKFGAMIVDSLREYRQPVFVYLPPWSELRGGSWVVLDSSINPTMIEMYADSNARSGILEPEATVEIKYRNKLLKSTMDRLDPQLIELKKNSDLACKEGNEVLLQQLQQEISLREKALMPLYQEIATHFAELHDTPGRMKAKGVIRSIVDWREARRFFYHRLSRRLYEERFISRYPELTRAQCLDTLKALYIKNQAIPTSPTMSKSNKTHHEQFQTEDALVKEFYQAQEIHRIHPALEALTFSVVKNKYDQLIQRYPSLSTKNGTL